MQLVSLRIQVGILYLNNMLDKDNIRVHRHLRNIKSHQVGSELWNGGVIVSRIPHKAVTLDSQIIRFLVNIDHNLLPRSVCYCFEAKSVLHLYFDIDGILP